jgi:hypothetical protein
VIHLPRGRAPAGASSECRGCGAVVSAEQMACLSCGSMVARRRVPWRTPAAGVVALMLFGATGISFAMSEVSTGDELKLRKVFSAAPASPPATPAAPTAPASPTSPPAGGGADSSAGSGAPPALPASPSTPPVGAPLSPSPNVGASSFHAGGGGTPGSAGSSGGGSNGSGSGGDSSGSDGGDSGSDEEPGASPATKVCEGPTRGGTAPGWPAETTAYTVVLRQTKDHAKAMAMYDRAREAGGENSGVLCADDYPLSFNATHKWVTFTGQCKTREAAERERGRLEEKNLSGKVVLVDGGGEAPADASGSTSC